MSDAPVIVASPPPYKDRRGWLIAFGTFEILIGCVLLLMIAITILGVRSMSSMPATPPGTPSPAATMAMVAVFYGVLAVIFVVVGIGSIQAKRWARIAMLVISWCWLALGVLGMLMMALIMPMIMENAKQQARTPIPEGTEAAVRIVMLIVMGLLFILLPLLFVLFYSGKNVKATIEAASRQPSGALRKPVGVLVASGLFAFSAISCAAVALMPFFTSMPMAFPLYGTVITGVAARVYAFVMAGTAGWLAWKLYQQRAFAWWGAVGWLTFSWLSGLVTQLRLGLLEMYHRMGYGEDQLAQIAPFLSYGLAVGWLIGIAFLIFLLAIRKQFTEPATT